MRIYNSAVESCLKNLIGDEELDVLINIEYKYFRPEKLTFEHLTTTENKKPPYKAVLDIRMQDENNSTIILEIPFEKPTSDDFEEHLIELCLKNAVLYKLFFILKTGNNSISKIQISTPGDILREYTKIYSGILNEVEEKVKKVGICWNTIKETYIQDYKSAIRDDCNTVVETVYEVYYKGDRQKLIAGENDEFSTREGYLEYLRSIGVIGFEARESIAELILMVDGVLYV